MKNVTVTKLPLPPQDELDVEIVERKGTGHPDYIADAVSEEASRQLSLYYLKEFGHVFHHNLDKTLLVGGQASPRFGGGDVLQPIYIIISGRAVTEVRTDDGVVDVPLGTVLLKAAKDWLKKNLPHLDVEHHVVVDYKVGKGSADLVGVFELGKTVPLANDTSVGVGFAPFSTLEKLVYTVERKLNSAETKAKIKALGEDIKVMGLRMKNKIKLTVAAAIVSEYVRDAGEYAAVKEEVKEIVEAVAHEVAPNHEVEVFINTADNPEKGIFYLTVTGTSAEHGDDGATGRGNRVNGLITPMRPMSLEAAAGKNPVNHVGKLYNVLANIAAQKVVEEVPETKEVYLEILSQIGRPITDPLIAAVRVKGELTPTIEKRVKEIIEAELDRLPMITKEILEGKISVF
ncbi:methionine adenosyltransferase [Ignicoccus hospitalis]|uniref:Methionine adenosyltransferase n=1 Tax=Ignicoccus hospitalis (strain KIN4/I / DSM 18386 / JCM 14125) TaxID=453591 RepID=A8A8U0_IGNH4|nr:methionine adenosyltransferase [Ignicoccus hospitalis]ABU81342.1 Methionine adenosyltransferase [Ignicoccus hospitalis KIN4/I]HIH90355.1 methionine adenosyltransferase [Desulfurococcaceae archaeon]